MTQPQIACENCIRLRLDGKHGCDAFPGGIPPIVLLGEHDHKAPLDGDNGLQFERTDRVRSE